MVLHFRTQEMGIEWGDTEAYLTGYTMDGMAIEGRDVIAIVPSEGEKNGDISSEDEDKGHGKGKAKGKSKVRVRGNSNANAEAVDDEDEDEAENEDSGKGKGNGAPAKGVRISPIVWGRMKLR